MAVNPINFGTPQISRDIDFASMGQQLMQSHQQAQKRALLQSVAEGGGKPEDLIRAGLQTGDIGFANLGQSILNRQAEQQRQAQQDQLQRERYGVEDQFKRDELKLKERALSVKEPSELERRARAGGLTPGTKEYSDFMLRGGRNADVSPSAADKKEIFKSEDAIPALDATIANIQRAKELNPQVFSGYGAGARGALGAKLPDWMVPDFVASKKGGDATVEWDQLMGQEAIKMMSDTLKGASTDFEMRKFLGIAADTSLPPKVRDNAMNRFLTLANQEKELRVRRTKELRDNTYFKPEGGARSPAAGGAGDPSAPVRVNSPAERDALPPGAKYIAPDGSVRTKR